MKNNIILMFFVLSLTACAGGGALQGVDPTISWQPVTIDCAGNAEMSLPLTYNVFVVDGAGPIPTIPSGSDEVPCGIVQLADLAQVQPLNQTPLAAPPYFAIVTAGIKTFAVEAVDAASHRSALSAQVTKNVKPRPGVPQSIQVGSVTIHLIVVASLD